MILVNVYHHLLRLNTSTDFIQPLSHLYFDLVPLLTNRGGWCILGLDLSSNHIYAIIRALGDLLLRIRADVAVSLVSHGTLAKLTHSLPFDVPTAPGIARRCGR